MNGFGLRLWTAVFFVGAVLGAIYGGAITFLLFFGLINALCLWEFYGMTISTTGGLHWLRRSAGTLLGTLPFTLAMLWNLGYIPLSVTEINSAFLLIVPILFSLFIVELYAGARKPFLNMSLILLGLLYVSMPFLFLCLLAFDTGEYRYAVVLGLILLTWTNDTGAYLFGSWLGKNPLFPRISPKKTWEGVLFGLFFTLLAAWGLYHLNGRLQLWEWQVLAVIVTVFGTFGDLIESMLKRSFRVKDSSNLLPGHGGVLDRFDSFIFHLPFAFAFLFSLG